MIFGTQTENVGKTNQDLVALPSSREEEPDFDYIKLCSPGHKKLDSFLGMINILWIQSIEMRLLINSPLHY